MCAGGADFNLDGAADLAVYDSRGAYVLHGPWSGAMRTTDTTAYLDRVGGPDGTLAAIDGVLAVAEPDADGAANGTGAVSVFWNL